MKKGTWYYEMQILMFVIMWQHDMTHKSSSNLGLRLGRLYVWLDSQWTKHSFGEKLIDILKAIKNLFLNLFEKLILIVELGVLHIFNVVLILQKYWIKIKLYVAKKDLAFYTFYISLRCFLTLSKAGFRITASSLPVTGNFVFYRFWWGDKVIEDFADIDCVDGRFYTMFNGKSKELK